jgi:hypothetical protein
VRHTGRVDAVDVLFRRSDSQVRIAVAVDIAQRDGGAKAIPGFGPANARHGRQRCLVDHDRRLRDRA